MLRVAVAHDYLTQLGGAERVVLSMMRAFPGAPVHTSLFDSAATFPEFGKADIRPLPLDRLAFLRQHHRWALPLLATAFGRLHVEADVLLCSSSGWAHAARTTGRKVVYCYSPARWLYSGDQYLGGQRPALAAALGAVRPRMVEWDRQAAATAHRYLTLSRSVRDRIKVNYGVEAEVLPPPPTLDPKGDRRPVEGLDAGFFLCVARLLPYKNVDAVIAAFDTLPGERLVVVGVGPELSRLKRMAGRRVSLIGSVADDQLRWLYESCAGVVAASYEDYGLTPLEGARFGRPSVVLRWGGFLDTVVEHETGQFFDEPTPSAIARGVRQLTSRPAAPDRLKAHAELFSEERFIRRLRQVVAEEGAVVCRDHG